MTTYPAAYPGAYAAHAEPPLYNKGDLTARTAKALAPKRTVAVPVTVVPATVPPATVPPPAGPLPLAPVDTPPPQPAAPECRTVTQLGYADGKETQRQERYCRIPPAREWVRS